jgi:glycosyltransferase involved in cell wall biosynthesis
LKATWLTTFGGETYGQSGESGGVAAFSAELVRALRAHGIDVDVLAETTGALTNDPPWVDRTWRPGSLGSIWRALRERRPNLLHVQHEIFLYGGMRSALGLPLLLALARLRGIRVILTLHGVVDLHDVDADFCRRNGVHAPPFVVRAVFWLIFRMLATVATRCVVHAEVFRDRLSRDYGVAREKIDVVPLILPEGRRIAPQQARAELGLPAGPATLLFFGFVTAYKGMDELFDAFDILLRRKRDVHLVIAGGAHPKRAGDPAYQRAYEAWRRRAVATGRCTWLGYVDGQDVDGVLSAADVMVLPYRELLAMSGPLSSAAAHDLRVVCSEVMREVVEDDVPVAELRGEPFADAIERALAAPPPASFARWRSTRSAEAIAGRYQTLYDSV